MIIPILALLVQETERKPSGWGSIQEVKGKGVLIREERKVDLMAEAFLLSNI